MRLIISFNEQQSKTLECDWSFSVLPYLLYYIMGTAAETDKDVFLDANEAADILLKFYDFKHNKTDSEDVIYIFDLYEIWEKYCSSHNVILSISYFFREDLKLYITECCL